MDTNGGDYDYLNVVEVMSELPNGDQYNETMSPLCNKLKNVTKVVNGGLFTENRDEPTGLEGGGYVEIIPGGGSVQKEEQADSELNTWAGAMGAMVRSFWDSICTFFENELTNRDDTTVLYDFKGLDEGSNSMNGSVEGWLQALKEVSDYMLADGNWVWKEKGNKLYYEDAKKETPPRGTNCAQFVVYALQHYGLFDKDMKFYGDVNGNLVANSKARKKFDEVADIYDYSTSDQAKAKEDLQPGDIVIYYGQHTNVYIGKDENGKRKWYDAGRWSTDTKSEGGTYVTFTRTGEIGMSISHIIRLKFDSGSSGSSGTTVDGFVQYYQGDYADVPFGSSNIAGCGCGITAFAMVASTLNKKQITPKDIVDWCGNTYYVPGKGISWAFFGAASKKYNLKCTETTSYDTVVSALKSGKLVISSQNGNPPALFTDDGHLIVLAGIDSDNKITVRDPNKYNAVNKGYNNRKFTKSEIDPSSAQYWIFSK